MSEATTILITGAAGNLGAKLRRHLVGRYDLRLLDINPRGDPTIFQADLSRWDKRWVDQLHGVNVVVHLAADPTAQQTWPNLIGPNIDAVINVFRASVLAGVKRVVFASSNHVMGGYQDDPEPALLTPEVPPRPGTHYVVDAELRDSTAYAAAKLFGERLGKCYGDAHGLSTIAVRIGWVRTGDNRAQDIPAERGSWYRLMWLSNRDFCQLMERCILAASTIRFAVVNGMSANPGMRWDIETTRRLVGYVPEDHGVAICPDHAPTGERPERSPEARG
jgi:nucleoside-diphosphate-sugar epimerase